MSKIINAFNLSNLKLLWLILPMRRNILQFNEVSEEAGRLINFFQKSPKYNWEKGGRSFNHILFMAFIKKQLFISKGHALKHK